MREKKAVGVGDKKNLSVLIILFNPWIVNWLLKKRALANMDVMRSIEREHLKQRPFGMKTIWLVIYWRKKMIFGKKQV